MHVCVRADGWLFASLCAFVVVQDEDDEDETQEEDGEAASGDYIGERLARARLEATGQLYREVRARCGSAMNI